jgi:hypothetical protein
MRALRLAALLAVVLSLPSHAQAEILKGRVTGPEGEGVDDVDLDIDDLATGDRIPEDDKTNSTGFYEVRGIPRGIYRVTFDPPGSSGFAPLVVEPWAVDHREVVLDVELPQGFELRGRVTDETGADIAEVNIDVIDVTTGRRLPTPGDNTGSDGRYSVTIPQGIYNVEFRAPVATGLLSERRRDVAVSFDFVLDTSLSPGRSFSGTVTSTGGAPAGNVDIDLLSLITGESVVLAEDDTDAAGHFALIVPEGSFRVNLDAPLEARLVSKVVSPVEITGDLVQDFELEPGHLLSGTAKAGGRPLEDVDFDFFIYPTLEEVSISGELTDWFGRYGVVLEEGTYDVIARPPSSSPWPADTTFAVALFTDRVLDVRFGFAGNLTSTDPGEVEAGIVLSAARPNPSPGAVAVELTSDADLGEARLDAVDGLGRFVGTLWSGRLRKGSVEVVWDGRTGAGTRAAAGVYFLRLETSGGRRSSRVVLLR